VNRLAGTLAWRLRQEMAAEDAFTLPELLVVIVISSIIVTVIAASMIVGLRSTAASSTRLNESHDAQMAAAYFAADASNASSFSSAAPDPASCAAGLTNVAHFAWADAAGAQDVFYVTTGSPATLVRRACVNNVAGPDVSVVRHLSGTPTITCPLPAASCSATPADVQLNVIETTGYSYALRGVPRPMSALPPPGNGGPKFAVYVGSGGMSLKGNSTITNTSGQLVADNGSLTCSGSGVTVSPPFIVSGGGDVCGQTAGGVPADPLRNIPEPNVPGLAPPPQPNGNDCGSSQLTYRPGHYLLPVSFDTACLASGVYYLDGGGSLKDVHSAPGGVMLYLPPRLTDLAGAQSLSMGGVINLAPMTSATVPDSSVTPGVTVFLGRNNAGTVSINGSAGSSFIVQGIIYAPAGELDLQSNNANLNVGMVDVKTLQFKGNGDQITLI